MNLLTATVSTLSSFAVAECGLECTQTKETDGRNYDTNLFLHRANASYVCIHCSLRSIVKEIAASYQGTEHGMQSYLARGLGVLL